MKKEQERVEEKPSSFWYPVYFGVIIFALFIISLLAAFSWYFSR